jgi:hypothetical protein
MTPAPFAELELRALPAGALSLASITLDGTAIDFADVLADLTIRHGRTGYFEATSPSTCTLTYLGVDRAFTRPFRLGATLVVNAFDGSATAPRFTGKMTDAKLDVDVLTATAVSTLRTLSGYEVGGAAWPEEAWSARVQRAFSDAGIPGVLELELGAFDPILVARAAEPTDLGAYLEALAGMVDAAVADRPNGNVLVQAIDSRALENLVELDPAEVGYAPEWTLVLPEANIVTVSYGDPSASASVSSRDEISVGIYGPIAAQIATTVRDNADASRIASTRLARNAYAHWTIQAAPLLYGRTIPIGTPLELSTLPASSPYDPWTPILEGWTDHVESDGLELTWTQELGLSDPLRSGLTLPWQAIPPDYLWNTINQATEWKDALTLSDLAPPGGLSDE